MAIRVGTNNDDTLYGTAEDDIIKGYGGNDVLKGTGGADTLIGGDGIDIAMYSDSSAGVTVNLEAGTGTGGAAQGDRLTGIENLWGSSYNDILTGNSGANNLFGSDGHDFLFGREGADVLNGSYGNDVLDGGAGDDWIDGGAGWDQVTYLNASTGVTVSLINHTASGGAGNDTLYNIEDVIGSGHNDVVTGNSWPNYIHGDLGDDAIRGGGGADHLYGGGGLDTLYGEDGSDELHGREDRDILLGGMGADNLSGGSGGDSFVWQSSNETGVTIEVADVIWDFSFAEGDRIDLSAIDADVYAAGNQAFTFIGSAAFSGTPGEINYVHLGGNTYLQIQTGTSTDVEGIIRIAGIVTPEASWFVL